MANNAKHPQITLLLTRPLRGSQAFLEALPADTQGKLSPIIAPLIRIEPVSVSQPFTGDVVFTSANGPLLGPDGQHRTAYCVGAQTAQAAQNAGWQALHLGNNADDLVGQLVQLAPEGPLTHLCGVHTRGNIAARLGAVGIETCEVAIYDQVAQPLSDRAIDALRWENPVVLPLFSPRTARQFANQYNGGATLHIIALSEAVADEINKVNAISTHICTEPTRKAMLRTLQFVTASIPLG